MAEHDEWTAADDARLRAALTSLRTDVEAAPLPDVRFVKARGMARRRRGFLAAGAAAAAAAVVAGTVGYGLLAPDPDLVRTPAARSSTTDASASAATPVTTSLDTPGILPLAEEWETSLDLPSGSARLVQATTLEGAVECADGLGRPTQQQSLTQANSPISGAATYWETGGDKASVTALEQSVAKCQAGPGFTVTTEHVGDYSLHSYSAKGAGSGWFAVVSGGQGMELLQLVDPAFPDVKAGGFTEAELGALAQVARARLERYATAASPTSGTGTSGPGAVDEEMTVTGPDPVPSATLFVAASQWASPALTGGATTSAGPGALEGSTTVASCETDDQQAGIGGRVGVVSVRTGTGATGYVGRQRVQQDDATAPSVQKAYVSARLAEAKAIYAAGCKGPNTTVTSTPGPTPGTYRLDTVFTDGSPTLSEWVGVTAQKTPGAVSTVVITAMADPQQGFAELDRLLALARQK